MRRTYAQVGKKDKRKYTKRLLLVVFGSKKGLPLWLNWLRIRLQCKRPGLDPWVGKIPGGRERLPTPVKETSLAAQTVEHLVVRRELGGFCFSLRFSMSSSISSESYSVVSNSLQPHGLYSPWNSPGQNTGMGSLSFLQGIFPTQGSNPGLLHCRWILYQLSHKGSLSSLMNLNYLSEEASEYLGLNTILETN